jgi:hypothetical protein
METVVALRSSRALTCGTSDDQEWKEERAIVPVLSKHVDAATC